jgi:hypothetical protein
MALAGRGGVSRMIRKPCRPFPLLGRRSTKMRGGMGARLLLRQLGLQSIEPDRRCVKVRRIVIRGWIGPLPLAGFGRGAPQHRREPSPRGRLIFGQSLGTRDDKQQGCAAHQVEPGTSF